MAQSGINCSDWGLNHRNYVERLIELLNQEDRIRRGEFLPMETNIELTRCGKNQYELHVPKNRNSTGYDASIRPLHDEKAVISAKFSDRDERVVLEFDNDYGSSLTVAFKSKYSNVYFINCKEAVREACKKFPKKFFFPTEITFQPKLLGYESIKWFNDQLNDIQKRAVVNVVNGACRPHPYVIFGPPGTGKTSTLVETILQILRSPKSRILVVGPTNSSVDEVTEKLMKYRNNKDTTRLASLALYEEKQQDYYSLTVDDDHKIVLTTTQKSLFLLDYEYTHIFIDEAGKVSEPEAMVPLQFLQKDGVIVMAGDHKQLRPYTRNYEQQNYGLHVSFLERMMSTPPYLEDKQKHEHGYDERLITMLKFNYRSLRENVQLTSDVYYNHNLVHTLSETDSWVKDLLSALPPEMSEGGVFVHPVQGDCVMDRKVQSYYNDEEALHLILFVVELFKRKFKPDDIGIITPYRGQKYHITNLFRKASKGLKLPKIGTVEDFQGREKLIILISTVRSNKRTMGFVDDPRRLNVMLSRAKILSVIFGDLKCLNQSSNVRDILEYCKTYQSFQDFTLSYV